MGTGQSSIVYQTPVTKPRPGESAIYRNPMQLESLVCYPSEQFKTY